MTPTAKGPRRSRARRGPAGAILIRTNRTQAVISMTALVVRETAGDQATAEFGVRRIATHAKNAWMLRSHLE